MIGEYRFLRTRGGRISFASVSVVSGPADKVQVSWDPSLSQLQGIFGSQVEEGVELAFREHQRRGGSGQAVVVTNLGQTPADTTLDAIRCAAAIAAWKSWGHSEHEATVSNDGEGWIVIFKSVPASGQNP